MSGKKSKIPMTRTSKPYEYKKAADVKADAAFGPRPKQAKGKHLADGRALAKASRSRTPGWAAGSEQDKVQRRIAGREAAKALIGDTIKHNRKKGKKK